MKLWQKYIRNRLQRTQARVVTLSARDLDLRADVILRSKFKELREFIREDLERTDFSLRGGLKYAREMEDLCSSYAAAITLERVIYNHRCRHYIEVVLEPEFAEQGYKLMDGTLGSIRVSFQQPDGHIVSFPRGDIGVYQCEKLLAELTGEEVPPFDLLEVRKRIEKCCPRPKKGDKGDKKVNNDDAGPEKTDN